VLSVPNDCSVWLGAAGRSGEELEEVPTNKKTGAKVTDARRDHIRLWVHRLARMGSNMTPAKLLKSQTPTKAARIWKRRCIVMAEFRETVSEDIRNARRHLHKCILYNRRNTIYST
jgi:hypothetical protein